MKPRTDLEMQILLMAQQSEFEEVGVSVSAGCGWGEALRGLIAMRSLARKGLLRITRKEVDAFDPVHHIRYKITKNGKQFLHDAQITPPDYVEKT